MKLNKSGFTLLELITVILMIGITAALVIPTVLDWKKSMDVSATSRRLQGVLQQARLAAIDGNQAVVVEFAIGYGDNGYARAFIDTDLSNAWNVTAGVGEPIIAETFMPADVQLLRSRFRSGSSPTTYTSYTPAGFPSTGFSGNIIIGNRTEDNFQRLDLSPAGNISVVKQSTVF